jgi:hypothetical protein
VGLFAAMFRWAVVGCAVTTTVAGSPIAARAAQSNPPHSEQPVRISRWPCRIVAPPSVRKVMDRGWDRSETIRRQCNELAAARAVVALEWGTTDSQSHAATTIGIHGGVVTATVRLPALGDTVVLLAHELHHVLERTRGLDLAVEAERPGSGVWRTSGGYETQGAVDVSRQVARELRDNGRSRQK